MRKLILLLVTLALAGCKQMPDVPTIISPYRIDIQQGNVVTQDMVAKLKPGMTRAQVRYALGSPLVVDPFRTDRWDYVYTLQKQGKVFERRNITVIFDSDKLVRIEGDVVALQPGAKAAEPAAAQPSPAAKPAAAGADKPATPKPAAGADAAQRGAAKTDGAGVDAAKAAPDDASKEAVQSGTAAARPGAGTEDKAE